jgi:hypothetical protein
MTPTQRGRLQELLTKLDYHVSVAHDYAVIGDINAVKLNLAHAARYRQAASELVGSTM